MWGRGTVLGGRYTLSVRLGGGAMGEVWRAEDGVLERPVAVKILLPALLDDVAFMDRFRGEARTLAALDHPGIVDVHDYGEGADDGGTPIAYIVMELISGRPLDELLAEGGALPAGQALDLAAQALDALHAAHQRGVVHRDVKPANLMVGDDGRVVVTDFGIARAMAGKKVTSSHVVLGTALYVAPERAEGSAAGPRADLYSMGVVCYEMLTGEPPFTGETALEIVLKHVRAAVPELPGERFAEPVRQLVARALAKQPAERFADAGEMAAAVRRAAADLPAAPAALAGTEPTLPLAERFGRLGQSAAFKAEAVRAEAIMAAEAAGPTTPPARAATADLHPSAGSIGDTGRAPSPAGMAAAELPEAVATVRQQRRPQGWRRLLVPVLVPCCVTIGVGTVLLVDPAPYRSDAGPTAPRAVVSTTAGAPGGAGSPTAAPPGASPTAVPSTSPSGAPSPTGSPSPAAPTPGAPAVQGGGGTPQGQQADPAVVPGGGSAGGTGGRGNGSGGGSTGGGTAGGTSGGSTGGGTGGAGSHNGSSGGGTSGGSTGGTGGTNPGPGPGPTTPPPPPPPRPTPAPTPAPPTPAPPPGPPQGCGGTDWGYIVNVGDGQRLGLASDSLTSGTKVVTGGATADGWVRVAGPFDQFHACNLASPALAEVFSFSLGGSYATELGQMFPDSVNWHVAPADGGASYIQVQNPNGQGCLTDHGTGNPVTVESCTPGNASQEWHVPGGSSAFPF
ncbi:protein kinase domain-containing protein [Kitasatospora sp. LaBMicrA B282]|uniref:serine/threonine-protein kinase n=1 Tax=Kitasatospora sp. LaBMicrA B282 TaxID=3420949 RepID=UPI003D0C35C0